MQTFQEKQAMVALKAATIRVVQVTVPPTLLPKCQGSNAAQATYGLDTTI